MTRWQVFLMTLFWMDRYAYRNYVFEDIFIWCDMYPSEYDLFWKGANDNDYVRLHPPSGV